ncbi:hypothetical protein F4802DRAFT_591027 [Xylaria palmicola]|nr:hypothetical protein F4802DRAFT_591027 [Xylaria palmicola]
MADVKDSFIGISSIITFLRRNVPGLAAIGNGAGIFQSPRAAEITTVVTTGGSRDSAIEANAVCASSQNDSDSGYASAALERDLTDPAMVVGNSLTFSRKQIPQQFIDRLIDIRALFTEPLLDTMSAKQRVTKGASMKLKYADQDDKLYLVVQCDKRDKKKLQKFFAKSHVVEVIGHDITVHITTGLRHLTTEEFKVHSQISGPMFSGTLIRIEGAHGSSTATLGGTIRITKDGHKVLCGLTAGHALTRQFPGRNCPSTSHGKDIVNDSDISSESDGSSDLFDNHRFKVCSTSHSESTSCATPELESQIGSITEHSFQSSSPSTNYDWALVKLRDGHVIQNRLPQTEPNKQISGPFRSFKLFVSAPTQTPASVIIPTSRGNQRGKLTLSTSSLLVAPGHKFVETHDVVLNDGFSLQAGDSGSWAIDEITGEFYGHVVSIDMFGEAYVMPSDDTLRDIREHLQADCVDLSWWGTQRQAKREMQAQRTQLGCTLSSHAQGLKRGEARKLLRTNSTATPRTQGA